MDLSGDGSRDAARRQARDHRVTASPATGAISDQRNRSDHAGTGGATDWSIQRDDPAATTVELPPGTTAADITDIVAYRVVHGDADPRSAVRVTSLIRGFFLRPDYTPGRSFVSWTGSQTLTAANPSAPLVGASLSG